MSAPAFAVPVGDPETMKRAAGTFGTLSSDHQGQLAAFNGQVQNALANWRGPVAEQYAVVAGDAARRFSAVVTALTAVQTALGGYASALEAAQLTGVHDRTIRRWIVAQRLPARRQGCRYLIDRLNLSMTQRSSPLNRREQSLVFRCPSLRISGQSAANPSVAHLNGMTVNTGAR